MMCLHNKKAVFALYHLLKAPFYVHKQYPLPLWLSQLTSAATAVGLFALAACAPLPPKPEIIKEERVTILPVEVIIEEESSINAPEVLEDDKVDNNTEAKSDLSVEDLSEQKTVEIQSDDGLEDNSSQTKIATFTAPKPVSPQSLLTDPLPTKPQAPDPLDPYIFLEKSQSYLHSMIGKPDAQFNEQGILIAHYKEESCQLLAFLASDTEAARVIHIDVRPAFVDSSLDKDSCFQDLGKRADEIENN